MTVRGGLEDDCGVATGGNLLRDCSPDMAPPAPRPREFGQFDPAPHPKGLAGAGLTLRGVTLSDG
jgi:hypothetical protein